jgi:hypothetical protein
MTRWRSPVSSEILTKREIEWFCCDNVVYEVKPSGVRYEGGVVTLEAGRPVQTC